MRPPDEDVTDILQAANLEARFNKLCPSARPRRHRSGSLPLPQCQRRQVQGPAGPLPMGTGGPTGALSEMGALEAQAGLMRARTCACASASTRAAAGPGLTDGDGRRRRG